MFENKFKLKFYHKTQEFLNVITSVDSIKVVRAGYRVGIDRCGRAVKRLGWSRDPICTYRKQSQLIFLKSWRFFKIAF